MFANRVVQRTESVTQISVYYVTPDGRERRKKFQLLSAAERFVANTPSAYRVDTEPTSLMWLGETVESERDLVLNATEA